MIDRDSTTIDREMLAKMRAKRAFWSVQWHGFYDFIYIYIIESKYG